jgi:hypothetical protein
MANSTGSKQTPKVPPRKTGAGGSRPPANRGPRRARRGRSQGRFYAILVGAIIAIVAVVVIVILTSGGSSTSALSKQPAINFTANGAKVYGGLGPEGVPLELGTPLAAANTGLTGAPIDGIQCNTNEQLVYHHHVHVAIFINGQPRAIPLGVGMVPPALVSNTPKGPFAEGSNTCLYWLHVHAQDGIVHIESPEARAFVLGQVFGIWQQPLSPTQIGPYTGQVTATVNGQPWQGDPAEIPLNEHTQIVLNLNGPVVHPPPIDWNGTGL